jgi:hypothetical protein
MENSYLSFKKSEDGTVTGTIALNDGNYSFQHASPMHLASTIAMALGVDITSGLDASVRQMTLNRLGKSIDILTKAQVVAKELRNLKIAKTDLPGKTHAPQEQKGPKPPQAPTNVQASSKKPSFKLPKIKLPKTAKQPRPPSLKVGKAEQSKHCSDCDGALFSNGKFTGCVCLYELAKSTRTIKFADGCVLEFDKGTDIDLVEILAEQLRQDNG